ncbi:hypothetical protein B0T24DRAFT_641695 [Lasiosphaeria ovina]|uniref:Uncharacterized protein n=1 Tax=Lasiosphaeria ovina TaxID=92902 RepID=A0AAE0JTZ1_9PEZI|nr:hypothetical protein B0T24DRAFT_641695 [Lasiosphaeria ovina]
MMHLIELSSDDSSSLALSPSPSSSPSVASSISSTRAPSPPLSPSPAPSCREDFLPTGSVSSDDEAEIYGPDDTWTIDAEDPPFFIEVHRLLCNLYEMRKTSIYASKSPTKGSRKVALSIRAVLSEMKPFFQSRRHRRHRRRPATAGSTGTLGVTIHSSK